MADEWAPCTSCGGKGYTTQEHQKVDMNGKSRVEEVTVPCKPCSGTGKISVSR